MDYQYHTLSNGIRLVHKHADTYVAHCGIMIDAGSRDECENESGLAHFIEHVIFKGTKSRKPYHIISRLENVGGDLNAYTSKEETCIYASFLFDFYERVFELIADILINAVFPEKELDKEKDVILDEINAYKDSPNEEINDEFENLIFKGHPLGRNILGNPDSVKHFRRKDVIAFINRHYLAKRMVIASVGKIEFRKLVKIAEKYFSLLENTYNDMPRAVFKSYKPASNILNRELFQTHAVLGNIAYNNRDQRKAGLALLNNLLGGPGLNSRLNLAIREKHGLSYNVESNYVPYSDTGMFSIYLGTDNGYLDKTLRIISKELSKLRNSRLGSVQLKVAKQQIKGQIAIAQESNLTEMISMGKSMLVHERVIPIEEIYQEIDNLQPAGLMDIANEVFDENVFSMLIFKASKNGITI